MPSICFDLNIKETIYEAPTQWRMLGAEGKAEHVMVLCTNNGLVPATLLEVGAGDGAILRCLANKSFCKSMHAVEVSRSGVQVILGQHIPGLISCQAFNGYNLPFKDDSFDLVILSHVLEHVEYERALLREARRVSKYQVIEVPMDFGALENDHFQMLGPSYGHINVYSRSSLRYQLSIENFVVLDDMLGQYTLAVQEYDYFVNNSREKVPAAVKQFRACFEQEKKAFEALPVGQQERRASFYAALTRKETAQGSMARALNAAKSYINSGRVQAARLIFNHYIPRAKEIEASLDIARFSLQAHHWQVAQEFIDRVLKIEGSNPSALEMKKALPRDAARQVTAPRSSRDALKLRLKANFPFLVNLVRRLRR
jgi:ubiquinone/menaquinone biosynthesis C-methylase UbiE